jgi:hypothetical protein
MEAELDPGGELPRSSRSHARDADIGARLNGEAIIELLNGDDDPTLIEGITAQNPRTTLDSFRACPLGRPLGVFFRASAAGPALKSLLLVGPFFERG